jgi:hypothetical protein
LIIAQACPRIVYPCVVVIIVVTLHFLSIAIHANIPEPGFLLLLTKLGQNKPIKGGDDGL